jgi:class 3 adenylate cyclase
VSENTRNLSRAIEKSKNEVTVLFTDIVNSTQFWDKHGDTAGRLMLDRHNTLLFPVVEAFRGTVIKTIGDSIMASFKSPKDGVDAAIAMQQRLQKERKKDKGFKVHIRIGVHTGTAIVESNDVFGDTVNVAARVEGAAGKDEILVSEAAAKSLPQKKSRYGLAKRRKFVPKGKRRQLSVWVCDWKTVESRAETAGRPKLVPNRRQQMEIGLYASANLVFAYLLYHDFLRYFLADVVPIATYLVVPHPAVTFLLIEMAILLVAMTVRKIVQLSKPPVALFRLLKGGLFFGALFFASLWVFQALPIAHGPYWQGPYYETKHRFVEILADRAPIRNKPSKKSTVIAEANQGELYILNKIVKKKRVSWAGVVVRHNDAGRGYILVRRPPKMGIPPVEQVGMKLFVIRYYHLYALGLGALGFCFGAWRFRLKPL